MRILLSMAMMFAACDGDELERTCDELCAELVGGCRYAAFPDLDSCIEGCYYDASFRGADVEGQLACVQQADCDPFALIECEHRFGAD